MRRYAGFFLGLLLLALGSGFILFYSFYLDHKIFNDEVVIAVKPIPFKTEIKPDMVEVQQRKIDHIVSGAIRHLEDVIGMQSAVHIAPNTMIYEDLLDPFNVIPNPDEEIFSIPDDWIYAKPGSLRRTFTIDIYAFHPEPVKKKDVTNENLSFADEDVSETFSDQMIEEENETETRMSPHILDSEKWTKEDFIKRNLREPLFKDIVVAYAKDTANREVVGTNEEDIRLDASGNISNLDVVMRPEDYQVLLDHIVQGYLLIISYKF